MTTCFSKIPLLYKLNLVQTYKTLPFIYLDMYDSL